MYFIYPKRKFILSNAHIVGNFAYCTSDGKKVKVLTVHKAGNALTEICIKRGPLYLKHN